MTFPRHQFVMIAGFDNAATIEHDQPVGIAQGGETMGNSDSGAAAHQIFECFLNFFLGGCVDRGGGFVEDQNARDR